VPNTGASRVRTTPSATPIGIDHRDGHARLTPIGRRILRTCAIRHRERLPQNLARLDSVSKRRADDRWIGLDVGVVHQHEGIEPGILPLSARMRKRTARSQAGDTPPPLL